MRSKNFFPALTALLVIFTATWLTSPTVALAQQETILQSFNFHDGYYPSTGLIADAAGNLYGTTNAGGQYGGQYAGGVVFELIPNPNGGWTEKILHSFGGSLDGSYPKGALILDAAGNLYGTTTEGGDRNCGSSQGCGTVFELTPSPGGLWTEKLLYRFDSLTGDGFFPLDGLVQDGFGNLYGTTGSGGAYGGGTAFELMLNPDGSWTEKLLHNFNNNGADGWGPIATLTIDAHGKLYGTTAFGGKYNDGTVFELVPQPNGGWSEKILYSFPYSFVGASPSSLVLDQAGNLYGTTFGGGGFGYGTVFELTPGASGWTEKILYSFGNNIYQTDGVYPQAGLIIDAAGNLYGTTSTGGIRSYGTAFELKPSPGGKWTESVLHSFGGIQDGREPTAGLILGGSGILYGTTTLGGTSASGAVFQITP